MLVIKFNTKKLKNINFGLIYNKTFVDFWKLRCRFWFITFICNYQIMVMTILDKLVTSMVWFSWKREWNMNQSNVKLLIMVINLYHMFLIHIFMLLNKTINDFGQLLKKYCIEILKIQLWYEKNKIK